jgi:signal transduction histidine kinase/ligand-binding sensor domain-containing protein
VLGALSLLLAVAISAPPATAQREPAAALPLVHRHFSLSDGLPDTSVQALLQSRDGFLWVAAQALGRFNGSAFQLLSEANTPGLPESDLHALAEDEGGALWLGGAETEAGHGLVLARLQRGVLARFGAAEGVHGREVLALHTGPTGTLWVGTDTGLVRREGAPSAPRFATVAGVPGPVRALLEQPDGVLLAGTEDGLFSVSDGQVARLPAAAPGGPEPRVAALLRMRDGTTWAGTPEGLLQVGAARRLSEAGGLPSSSVLSLCEDHAGRLWVGTTGGLAVLWPGEPSARRVPEVVSSVVQVHEDRERNLWIGTDGDGLHQLRETAIWTHELRGAGLPGDAVYSVSLGRDGSIWAGTPSGLARLHRGVLETWPEVDGRRGVVAGPVVHAADGRLWVGTGLGIARLEDDELRVVAGTDGLPEGAVRGLLEDRAQNLWIGAESGLHRWKDGVRTTLVLGAADSTGWPRVLAEDAAGRLWAGTTAGLYRVEGGVVTRFGKADGLIAEQIYALLPDGDDLWVGTAHAGLHLVRDGRIHAVPPRARIPSRDVLGLALDHGGDLWQSSSLGLFRSSRKALLAAALGQADEAPLRLIDAADGLRSLDFNQHGQRSVLRAPDGRLWLANAVGLIEIDPVRLWANPAAPPVVIERLRVNGKQVALSGPLAFPVGAGAVEISYDAPLLRVPERVRFRFRLGGPTEPWVEAGNRRVASFQALPAGAHLFEVSAANDEGIWSEVGVSLAFSLEPPRWRSPVALLLFGLLLAGTVAGTFRGRSAQALRRERTLQALVDERTSQLARLNQDLAKNLEDLQRAQQHLVASDRRTSLGLLAAGVAHEINNPLAYITNNLAFVRDALPEALSGKAKASLAADLGDALGEALQGALRVKKIVGGLKTLARGDSGTPRGLVDVQAVLEAALEVATSELKRQAELVRDLQPVPRVRAHEVEIIQVMLNLVLNAAQSIEQAAAQKKPGPHKVTVRTRTGPGGEAVIEVGDTGAGMTPEVKARLFTPFFTTKPVGTGTGLGLSICQGIVTSLGGTISVESAPGAGATFTVTLPAAA